LREIGIPIMSYIIRMKNDLLSLYPDLPPFIQTRLIHIIHAENRMPAADFLKHLENIEFYMERYFEEGDNEAVLRFIKTGVAIYDLLWRDYPNPEYALL
jgi:hypothetical protein